MHQARGQRAPGSFSPITSTAPSRQPPPIPNDQQPRSSDDISSQVNPNKPLPQQPSSATPTTPKIYAPPQPPFTLHSNSSSGSLQNFSRPNPSAPTNRSPITTTPVDPTSPRLLSSGARSVSSQSSGAVKGHRRKHSNQGLFDPGLPSTSTSNLAHLGGTPTPSAAAMSASQIAAQAAVLSHKQQGMGDHLRQRSSTVPPGGQSDPDNQRRGSASRGPLSPPLVSLTEASVPRDSGFANQGYRNGLLGSHSAAATTAANVVFSRSGPSSPLQPSHPHTMAPPPSHNNNSPQVPEKPPKSEKSKVKLFSRPRKISTKGEADEKPLPSPGKLGSALSALQRANFSTTSLIDTSSASSLYSLANSSTATIRPAETPIEREPSKEKEKKHHFLSRQKHKLKEEYHLASSSSGASSFRGGTDLHGVYGFNMPPSPASTTAFPKSISGLDLRHGVRRDKRKEERSDRNFDAESVYTQHHGGSEWSAATSAIPGSYGSLGAAYASILYEPVDPARLGLTSISYDDAWPFLKAKLLTVFEGEDLRIPVEDLNKVVTLHIQYCVQRRSPNIILEDLRELLVTGFSSLDVALRKAPEERVIPALVELWMFAFTVILPYMQAVFLPLDQEFGGTGTVLTPEKARDFWGGVIEQPTSSTGTTGAGTGTGTGTGTGRWPKPPQVTPASSVLEVRRMVLNAYRDVVILPRYETLKTIFSRLALEFLPSSLASMALASPPLEPKGIFSTSPADSFASLNRPGTSAGSVADGTGGFVPSSYNSTGSTYLGTDAGSSIGTPRTRAVSNVSYGSATASDSGGGGSIRPFTPSSLQALGGGGVTVAGGHAREQNVEDSKQVTELVGRMLQCMSVLASVGVGFTDSVVGAGSSGGATPTTTGEADGGDGATGDEKMEELCRLLKLNWLGRGRTGRNRRGIVGGRVKRGQGQQQQQQAVMEEDASVV